MAEATLTIISRNYGSWSLRGWLLCRLAGLDFEKDGVVRRSFRARRTPAALALLPRAVLTHDGVKVWDTLAIAEYLDEIGPEAGLLPQRAAARAHCRAISGEMHSGFANLRSALPINLKSALSGLQGVGRRAGRYRPLTVWRECLAKYGGPFLFGGKPRVADAMYAPVLHALPHL